VLFRSPQNPKTPFDKENIIIFEKFEFYNNKEIKMNQDDYDENL
jgi:hypothetical protein